MSLEKLLKNKGKYFEGANSEITCMSPNKN